MSLMSFCISHRPESHGIDGTLCQHPQRAIAFDYYSVLDRFCGRIQRLWPLMSLESILNLSIASAQRKP